MCVELEFARPWSTDDGGGSVFEGVCYFSSLLQRNFYGTDLGSNAETNLWKLSFCLLVASCEF